MLLDLALVQPIYILLSSSLIDFLSAIFLKLIAHIMNDPLFLRINFVLAFVDYFRCAYVLTFNLFSRLNCSKALLVNVVFDDCLSDDRLYRIAILTLS